MNEITARHEFRIFDQSLGMFAEKMRQISPCEQIEESSEAYLVSAGLRDHNVKLRDGAVDIKRLIARRDGLEQWKPVVKQSFPISSELVSETLIPTLGTADVDLRSVRKQLTARELINEFFRPQVGICVASVFKRRFRFMVADCAAEFDEVLINGAAIQSAAIESEDELAVGNARTTLGMNGLENVSYPLAIQRVLGLQRLPQNAWYGFDAWYGSSDT
jgi:hypothetical protein